MESSKCGRLPMVISVVTVCMLMCADVEAALGGLYVVSIKTSNRSGAGTDADVFIKLFGTKNESRWYHLNTTIDDMEKGSLNNYTVPLDVGNIYKIKIKHDNTGAYPSWHLEYVDIEDFNRGSPAWRYRFPCSCWLNRGRGFNKTLARQGDWSNWSNWTSCTQTCGGGTRTRNRSCDNPIPSLGGIPCGGANNETESCETHTCPGVWSNWSNWTSCTQTCGGGTRTRNRSCDNPTPVFGGPPCVGANNETESCETHTCPVTGFLSQPQVKVGCPGGKVTFACAFAAFDVSDSFIWTKTDSAGIGHTFVAVNNRASHACCTVLANLSAGISDLAVNIQTRDDAGLYKCKVTEANNPTQIHTLRVPDYCFTTTPEATTRQDTTLMETTVIETTTAAETTTLTATTTEAEVTTTADALTTFVETTTTGVEVTSSAFQTSQKGDTAAKLTTVPAPSTTPATGVNPLDRHGRGLALWQIYAIIGFTALFLLIVFTIYFVFRVVKWSKKH